MGSSFVSLELQVRVTDSKWGKPVLAGLGTGMERGIMAFLGRNA